ncbi:putative ubiquitin-conjugating enzyme E2 J2-like [Apostichopus japonicus]|uniref:Ubiquitin-conjugating enzyme E2 J2 n=1 Tax=Stichopus japonicus TaxID=307972 RepID=A0A2G8L6L3_STIJA|nr:putative ubiquitin-conjugating enzyme E2 J2-like [Apostichopus japonicus]
MSTGKRVSTTATNRLKQDYIRIRKDPVPYVTAAPLPSNILEWHYVVRGPEKTPYEGGLYHGKLVFPQEFPFKPPSIYMITPNGRFKCNTRLCLSISDFHPDTWNPAWSVSTILTGLLSFMVELNPTLGSIETSDYTKRQLAVNSWEFNLKNQTFTELFPEIAESSVAAVCCPLSVLYTTRVLWLQYAAHCQYSTPPEFCGCSMLPTISTLHHQSSVAAVCYPMLVLYTTRVLWLQYAAHCQYSTPQEFCGFARSSKKVNKRLEELRASTESGGAVGDISRSLVQTGAVNFGDRQQGIVGVLLQTY